MVYCDLDDIKGVMSEKQLIQLTDDTVPPAAINEATVDLAIAGAGELIDGYLRGRYSLPLDPVPGLVKDLAVDITVYRLFKRRAQNKMPENIADDYKNTLKILGEIQKGAITIGATEKAAPPGAVSVGGAAVTSADRKFTRDKMKGL